MHNAAQAYRQNAVESAPPIKIVRMLFDAAIKFLSQAEEFDVAAETVQFNDRIRRTEAIVSELRLSLEASHNPELCAELERLYLFVEDELREAFLERDKLRVSNAKEILETLGDAWNKVKPDASNNVVVEGKSQAA